jgi:two-component system NtrC family sensor kinase
MDWNCLRSEFYNGFGVNKLYSSLGSSGWPCTCSESNGLKCLSRVVFEIPMRSMRLEIRIIVLALLAVAVVSVGAVNLREQHRYQLPDDGVFWVQSGARVVARDVAAESPAAQAGIQPGDILLSINGLPVSSSATISRQVFRLGVGSRAQYRVMRDGAPVDLAVALRARDQLLAVHGVLQVVGLLYLTIGVFVLFRRFSARRATHFFLFCVASFVQIGRASCRERV